MKEIKEMKGLIAWIEMKEMIEIITRLVMKAWMVLKEMIA